MQQVELIGAAQYRPFRNLWMLEELGVPYQHVPARPHSPEAKAANPTGKIPALKDGNFIMFESAAINTYLGDRFRKSLVANLVPEPGTAARGRYEQYVHFLQTEVDAQGLWIHRKHEQLGQYFGAIPEAVKHAESHTKKMLRTLAQELFQAGDYLLGDQFSAADILFIHCLQWAKWIGWDEWLESDNFVDSDVAQHLQSYVQRCTEREGYKRAEAIKKAETERQVESNNS